MNIELIVVRVKAFLYELASVVLFGVVAFFADFFGSEAFQELVTKHFGETSATVFILLIVNGIVKHLRNLKVLSAWKSEMGATGTPGKGAPELL